MSNQTLKTSDNELFKVEAVVAMKFCASNQYFDSMMTKAMTKTSPNAPPPSLSPLLNVESRALARRAHHLLQETSRENEREGI